MSKAVAWLLLLATPFWFVLAVQPARQEALAAETSLTQTLLQQGYRWHLNEPANLIGQRPVGVEAWTFGESGLRLQQASSTTYVPLNFRGRTLPAENLSRLRVVMAVSQTVNLRLFHRATLDGPAARSEAVTVEPNQLLVDLDLRDLHWTIDGRQSAWGQGTASVATLRVHPTDRPADLTLIEVHLAPTPTTGTAVSTNLQMIENPAAANPGSLTAHGQSWADWSPSALRRALDQIRVDPRQWQRSEPPARWLPGWPTYLTVAVILLGAMMQSRWRAAAALLLLAVSLWWGFSQAQWQLAGVAACLIALVLCVSIRYQPAARDVLSRRLPTPRPTGSLADLRRLAVLMALLLAWLVLTDDRTDSWRLDPGRWATYLCWAAVQQWVLCTVLYPLSLLAGAGSAAAIAVAALIFGLSHLPNLELMLMTWVLALGCLLHYSRHQQLLTPMALHGAAGIVLLAMAPTPMLYSASAGPGFWS
ncbi:MAG: CPBP family glutamic-type intramembrane protease [Pseudomonadota bacterium]